MERCWWANHDPQITGAHGSSPWIHAGGAARRHRDHWDTCRAAATCRPERREAARRSSCQNNIKQVGLALINYESANKGFPPSWIYDEETFRPHLDNEFAANWVVATLPFMEGQALYDAIDFTVPISAAINEPVRSTRLQSMLCPSDDRNEVPFNGTGTEGVNWARGNYGANAGNGPQITRWSGGITGPESTGWRAALRRGMIAPNVSLPVGRITDGTSNTLMLAELRRRASRRRSPRGVGPGSGRRQRAVLVRRVR